MTLKIVVREISPELGGGEILERCFKSEDFLWQDFLADNPYPRILYYPSAGTDFRPLLYANDHFVKSAADYDPESRFQQPNLFVFSDYYPWHDVDFWQNIILYDQPEGLIEVLDRCEIKPEPREYQLYLNPDYIDLDPSVMTGKAYLLKVNVHLRDLGYSYETNVLYFFYENVNLIHELFVRHHLNIHALVWQRDGYSLCGGGRLQHNFMLPLSIKLRARWFFIWDAYLDKDQETIDLDNFPVEPYPTEIGRFNYKYNLKKLTKFEWPNLDKLSLYKRVHQF